MAPARTRKQNTSALSDQAVPSFPAPPATVPTRSDDDSHTPEGSRTERVVGISQAQKQALVDNLQLEITERARKLRAQYAMQSQGLRARLEVRVNRIPQGSRKRNIQELLDDHAEKARPVPPPPVPVKAKASERQAVLVASAPRQSLKRQSSQISIDNDDDDDDDDDDKENLPAASTHDLAYAKKRARTATANTKATRAASRTVVTSTVLSPKSHNSRTLSRSPVKAGPAPAFEKAQAIRPVSPIKASIRHAASKLVSRVPSRQLLKRGAPIATEPEGRSSEGSNTSAGTTIVTKPAAKRAPVPKKPASTAKAAGGRKPAVAKKENVPPVPTGGGRTLRKRG